jgi:succinylarginine dihydrolase
MWAANAATASPSPDCADGRAHLTPANLASHLHRSLEAPFTLAVLRRVFDDPQHFVVHCPLPATPAFHDEGAANHLRFAPAHDQPGIEVFVFGHDGEPQATSPAQRHPARQSRLAAEAVDRLHGIRHTLFLRQHPRAIDAGAFHNDVASVAHLDTLFAHELCFESGEAAFEAIRDAFRHATGRPLRTVIALEQRLPIADAVASYLFNSQIVGDDPRALTLICPSECREIPRVSDWLDEQLSLGVFLAVVPVNLRQSMHNGGGPACLRLRLPLTPQQLAAVHPGVRVNPSLLDRLEDWVRRHHRDHLTAQDLADPQLLRESRESLDELSHLLNLGSIYPFQQA